MLPREEFHTMDYNPDEQLSLHFTLRQLTTTSQGTPNIPDDTSYANLKDLAAALELLWDQIGPFDVKSAYRSPETNAALQDQGILASSTSLHMQGKAADIAPLNTDIASYFVAIYANDLIRNSLGEIILKPTDGDLHVSTPTATKVGYAEILDPVTKIYRHMSASEIQGFLDDPQGALNASYQRAPQVTDDVDTELATDEYEDTSFPYGMAAAVLALAGAISFYIYRTRKR